MSCLLACGSNRPSTPAADRDAGVEPPADAGTETDWDEFPDPVYDCGPSIAPGASGDRFAPPSDPAAPIAIAFSVTVDPTDPALSGQRREPRLGVAEIAGGGDVQLRVGVKRPSQRPDLLWLELLFVNGGPAGIANARIAVGGLSPSYGMIDLDRDVWAEPTAEREFDLGRIAPFGTARYVVGIDGVGAAPVSLDLTLTGATSNRTATNSTALAVTPDGDQVWAPFADANVVAVVDAASRARVDQLAVEGGPSSVAFTPDGELALVAAPGCNQLSVFDRATRTLLQRFGEADGIGRDARHVVLSPDGTRAYVSAYVGDTVTVLDRRADGFDVAGVVAVGRRPTGMAVSPDGRTLYVAHFLPRGGIQDNEAWITAIDTDRLAIAGEGVYADDGNPEHMSCLQRIPGFDAFDVDELEMEGTPTALWGIFMKPAGVESLVTSNRIVPFPILEGDYERAELEFAQGSISTSNLVPTRTRDPSAIGTRDLDSVFDIPDRPVDFLRCFPANEIIEFATGYPQAERPGILQSVGAIRPTGTTPLKEVGQVRAIAYTRGGRRAIVVAYTSDELAVIDAATYHPTHTDNFLLSGNNPIGLAVSPDGATGYVAYANSTHLSVLDLSAYAADPLPEPAYVPFWLEPVSGGPAASVLSLRRVTRDISGVPSIPSITEVARIELVDDDPVDPVLRRGKILFNSANPDRHPEVSAHREASCQNCHPDGGNDGSMWPTLEGERRTLSLRGGVNGRGWLHASATYRDIREFVGYVTTERLGGTGLSDDDIHAMATYVARGIPRLQRPAVDDELAARGAEVFAASCALCHSGPRSTSGNPSPDNAYGGGHDSGPHLFDVGTRRDGRVGVIIGPAFTRFFTGLTRQVVEEVGGDRDLGPGDFVFEVLASHERPERKAGFVKAPSLVNVWDNALFFHDGRFTELEDAVGYINETLELGLDGDQLDAVVEYLKTL